MKTPASIPSKFETVLLKSPSQDGFGVRTERFTLSESEVPGPGAYSWRDPVPVGFRFTSRRGQKIETTPGPGAYDWPVRKIRVSRPAKPTLRRPEVVTPGPGSYDPIIRKRRRRYPVSKVPRCPVQRFYVPAPGTYDVAWSDMRVRSRGRTCPSLATKASRERLEPFVDSRPPPGALPVTAPPVNLLMTPPPSPMAGRRKAPFPGPGDYNAVQIVDHLNHSSSMFSNLRPRFTNATSTTPGPGWYEALSSCSKKQNKAPFSSSSRTSLTPRDAVPGPAFYAPRHVPRKSFHLNVGRRWLT